MTRAGSGLLLMLALLPEVAGCDAGEIVVFSAAGAGSAGASASAGLGGLAAGGSFGGSQAAAGGGGTSTSGTGGSGGDTVDKTCRATKDCDPSWFCQKQNCADETGVCLPAPLVEDPRRLEVCGCDHKTYWNDTLRQRNGISAILSLGPCQLAAQSCITSDDCCTSEDDCALATCSIQLKYVSDCSNSGSGQCWMIPTDCASPDDMPVALPCPPPGPPAPPPCLTLCEALQARSPYLRRPPSFTCQ